jgi:hypothetical protein
MLSGTGKLTEKVTLKADEEEKVFLPSTVLYQSLDAVYRGRLTGRILIKMNRKVK